MRESITLGDENKKTLIDLSSEENSGSRNDEECFDTVKSLKNNEKFNELDAKNNNENSMRKSALLRLSRDSSNKN